jgi:flagellar basal body-associated protein FliL
MKKKIIIILVVVLAGGGFVAKSMFLKPAVAKEKIAGTIYILPKQFTANLKDGRYATLTVALVLGPGQSTGAAAAEGGGAAPPEGFGTLPEEAAVRDIITNLITNQSSATLTSDSGREKLKKQILASISSGTDVKVHEILFTDLAVQ